MESKWKVEYCRPTCTYFSGQKIFLEWSENDKWYLKKNNLLFNQICSDGGSFEVYDYTLKTK